MPRMTTGSVALREWRILRGMTQHALAAKVGTRESTISNWEHGHRVPNVAMVVAIEAATDGAVTPRMWTERLDAEVA